MLEATSSIAHRPYFLTMAGLTQLNHTQPIVSAKQKKVLQVIDQKQQPGESGGHPIFIDYLHEIDPDHTRVLRWLKELISMELITHDRDRTSVANVNAGARIAQHREDMKARNSGPAVSDSTPVSSLLNPSAELAKIEQDGRGIPYLTEAAHSAIIKIMRADSQMHLDDRLEPLIVYLQSTREVQAVAESIAKYNQLMAQSGKGGFAEVSMLRIKAINAHVHAQSLLSIV